MLQQDASGWLKENPAGVELFIRARPGQKTERGARLVDIGEGRQAVELTVSALPQEGKANKALEEALAALLGIKKKQVALISGSTARLKWIQVDGDPAALRAAIEKLLF